MLEGQRWMGCAGFHPQGSLQTPGEGRRSRRAHHSILKCWVKGSTGGCEHYWGSERGGIMKCPPRGSTVHTQVWRKQKFGWKKEVFRLRERQRVHEMWDHSISEFQSSFLQLDQNNQKTSAKYLSFDFLLKHMAPLNTWTSRSNMMGRGRMGNS